MLKTSGKRGVSDTACDVPWGRESPRSSASPDASDRKGINVKKTLFVVLAVLVVGVAASAAKGPDLDALKDLAVKCPFVLTYTSVGDEGLRFLYVDNWNHVHVYRMVDGVLELEWEQTNLGTRVTSIFITDLYADGRLMLVMSTFGGRILVYDLDGYDLVWENTQDPFTRIDYMVSANVDNDNQQELIFIAEDKLRIYDTMNKTFEWVSQKSLVAQQILLGNVDDDPQAEIILNTGLVIDSKFFDIEFTSERPFGARIALLDLNGDGVPEIFGEAPDFVLRVVDVSAKREIW